LSIISDKYFALLPCVPQTTLCPLAWHLVKDGLGKKARPNGSIPS